MKGAHVYNYPWDQRRGESMIPMESMESMREDLEDFIDKTKFELDLKNKLLEV